MTKPEGVSAGASTLNLREKHPQEQILIATLGSEAQVITLTLDLLREEGNPITRVVIVHTEPQDPAIEAALTRLHEEFTGSAYSGKIRTRMVALQADNGPVSDVDSESGTEAVFRTLFREVRAAKKGGMTVHLSIAGGRKTMAVFGMTVAQLLFDEDDRLWHLISSGKLLEERRMHARFDDECWLVQVPVILWRSVSPVFTDLWDVDDPYKALERAKRLQLNVQLENARAFVLGSLTGAERHVTELLVREGLTDGELAKRRSVTPRTIGTHLEHVYAKARDHWGLNAINRSQLDV